MLELVPEGVNKWVGAQVCGLYRIPDDLVRLMLMHFQ